METLSFYKANTQSTFTKPGDVIAVTYGRYDTDVVYNLTTGQNYTLSQKDLEDAKEITHKSYPLYEREQESLEKYKLQSKWDLLK